MSFLSVIVPVYNTEKYLTQCIESIINQTYYDLEIILVDDGSTDGSADLCDAYENTDKRIKVIHQENKGLLSARLTGVQAAHGEYIGFVDSDDWIAEDMYEVLISTAEAGNRCDIVSMEYTRCEGELRIEENDASLYGLYTSETGLKKFFKRMMFDIETGKRGLHPALWAKIIKRPFILEELGRVDKRITMGEDAAVFYPCCLNASSIYSIQEYKYFYRMNEESMCHSIGIDIFEKVDYFYHYMQSVLTGYDEKYNLLNQLKEYAWTFLNQGLNQVFAFRVESVYSFPYTLVEEDSDIVLYGAGRVGQDYFYQLHKNGYCNIIAWMDKEESIQGDLVMRPEKISDLVYAKVVVAVKEKVIAEQIQKELVLLGVDEAKIIWGNPFKMPLRTV